MKETRRLDVLAVVGAILVTALIAAAIYMGSHPSAGG